MDLYPYEFGPIYKPKIWGGRSLERLFGRDLPDGEIGESWELADLKEGTCAVVNGPAAGVTLTDLTAELGDKLLGGAKPTDDGRFPLLLKFLDAQDILSLQVHPDAAAVREIGGDAALKTECWYIVESRDGYIYKGVRPGVTREQFRKAVEADEVEPLVRRIDVKAGDFHYLPAGTVHALGSGVVVAEVQTPSDTTYRVTDWGRGREIHVERSMQCIHFEPAEDEAPGADGETLLETEFFTVARRELSEGGQRAYETGGCTAVMVLEGELEIWHGGYLQSPLIAGAGETVLLPAGLEDLRAATRSVCTYLDIGLPGS